METQNSNICVSVIVPVYNTEKYLDRCLTSLCGQTLKEIEIICVNDGSTDNSLKILKQWAEKDSRIKVITQTNQKQGAARNRGIEIAQGNYLGFVDSDDWVDLNYFEELYNSIIRNKVNIAASNTVRSYTNKEKYTLKFKENDICVYLGVNSIIKGLNENLNTCGKIYKLNLIKDLRFEENILYEDAPYTIKAIAMCNSMAVVPNTTYHYFSNPTSTMKQKLSKKNRNDKISTNLQVLDFVKQNNINLKDWMVVKDNYFLWAVKHYIDRKDYYLFGIKIFSKNIAFDNNKTFLVFNTAAFGDVLLCNSLVQNIKNIFPESKVVFICDKNFHDAVKNQKDVDEVIIYDKKGENKGFFGFLKFVINFPYKKSYAAIITYPNIRNHVISMLIRTKYIECKKKFDLTFSVQKQHNALLSKFTNKKIFNYPIKYNVPESTYVNDLPKEYIVINPISKFENKNMPLKTVIELITLFNQNTNYKVVITGIGDKAEKFVNEVKGYNSRFLNYVNSTTIPELAFLIKNSACLISVDTGTMHLGCALDVPLIAVFYDTKADIIWMPEKDVYKNSHIINENQSSKRIFEQVMCAINENVKN